MSLLDKLRQKPDSQKKAIAFGIAICITLLIAIMWIIGHNYDKM